MKSKLNELRLDAGIARIENQQWLCVLDKETGMMIDPMIGLEKFAQLIVRECANIADIAEPFLASDLIKQHFGIEERKGWVCPKCGVDRTRAVCPKGHTAAITGDCPMTATAQSGVEEWAH